MQNCRTSMLAITVSAGTSIACLASPVTVPPDLHPGDKYRLAFVTSSSGGLYASYTDIDVYNTFVTNVANAVPDLVALETFWKVIGSTEAVDARDNTDTNPSSTGFPVYRLDGTRIANNNADLWDGSIMAPLDYDERGIFHGYAPGDKFVSDVVTGTYPDGTQGYAFGNLDGRHFVGNWAFTNDRWISSSNDHYVASGYYPYFAMSAVLTVVPEPSALVLGVVARGMMWWCGKRFNA